MSLVRGLALAALPLCVLQPLPNRGLFLRRGPARLVLSFLQFLPAAAVVDDPVDHAIVILQGHSRRAQRVFRLHRNGYNLPVDAGEQFRPFEFLGVFLNYVRGQERITSPIQAYNAKPLFFDIATQMLGVFRLKTALSSGAEPGERRR